MLVFNNQQRSGYEEIVSYGPKFYTSIKEMDAIYRFAGWTLDFMAADLEKLVAYQFIGYMDDATLTRFEHFLGISYDESKTLAARKTLAYANWSSSGKMSKTKIIKIVNTFAECDCEVSLVNSVLCVNMTFGNNPAQYMKDIRNLIRKVIPAHIEILYIGAIDTKIIFTWKNSTFVNKMTNKAKFLLYKPSSNMFLNGSWILDGTELLNKAYFIYPMNQGYKTAFVMTNEQLFAENILIVASIKQRMLLLLEKTNHTTMIKSSIVVIFSDSYRFGFLEKNDIFAMLTTNHDLWYLDDKHILDGSKLLDAYIKKEDL